MDIIFPIIFAIQAALVSIPYYTHTMVLAFLVNLNAQPAYLLLFNALVVSILHTTSTQSINLAQLHVSLLTISMEQNVRYANLLVAHVILSMILA